MLREELDDYFGKDVLATEPTTIDPKAIDDVISEMKTKPEDDDE